MKKRLSKRKSHKKSFRKVFKKYNKKRRGGVITRRNNYESKTFKSSSENKYTAPNISAITPNINATKPKENIDENRTPIGLSGLSIPANARMVYDRYAVPITNKNELNEKNTYIITIMGENFFMKGYKKYNNKSYKYIGKSTLQVSDNGSREVSKGSKFTYKPIDCYTFREIESNQTLVLTDSFAALENKPFSVFTLRYKDVAKPYLEVEIINPFDHEFTKSFYNEIVYNMVSIYKHVNPLPDKDFYNVSMVSRLDKRAVDDPNKSLRTLPIDLEHNIQNFLTPHQTKLD